MDKLNIVSTGFPGTNKTWRFVNDLANKPLTAIGKLIGNKTILSGIKKDGEIGNITYTDGYITFKGELMPFFGGEENLIVSIFEDIDNGNYNTDINDDQVFDNLPAYNRRYARLGDHVGAIEIFQFRDLRRLAPIDSHLVTYQRGSVYIGNLTRTDQQNAIQINIEFDAIPIPYYRILANFRLSDDTPISDNDLDWSFKNYSDTGFTLVIQATGGDFTGIYFEYDLVNTTSSPTY